MFPGDFKHNFERSSAGNISGASPELVLYTRHFGTKSQSSRRPLQHFPKLPLPNAIERWLKKPARRSAVAPSIGFNKPLSFFHSPYKEDQLG